MIYSQVKKHYISCIALMSGLKCRTNWNLKKSMFCILFFPHFTSIMIFIILFLCVLKSNRGTEIVKIYLSCLLKYIQKINKISNVTDVKMLFFSRAIERVNFFWILCALFMANTYSRLETVHKSIKKKWNLTPQCDFILILYI